MPRQLPRNKSDKHKLIISAVKDFFGSTPGLTKREVIELSCWLMNRKKGIKLTDEQLETAALIRNNIADLKYRQNLLQTP